MTDEGSIETIEASVEPETGAGRLSPAYLRGLVSEAEKLIDERRDIALQLKAVRDAARRGESTSRRSTSC